MKIKVTIFLVISSVTLTVIAVPVVNKDNKYNPAEQTALKKFRDLVGPLPQPYMNEDGFLINWIRANVDNTGDFTITRHGNYYSYSIGSGQSFDLNRAAKKLKETIAWRKENNIDGILSEDFSDIQKDFPFDISRKDSAGRPVFLIEFSNWDFKKGISATGPQKAKFVRYLDFILESGAAKARELKTSDFTYLIDAAGFNKKNHACPECLQFYQYFVQHFETHFPQMTKNLLNVNAPVGYDVVSNVLSENLTPASQKGFKVYDDNKEKWLKEVGQIIPVDQIPKHFVQPTSPTTTEKPIRVFQWVNACGGCVVPGG